MLQNNVLRTLRNFMNTEAESARSLRREYGAREGICMFILLLKFGSKIDLEKKRMEGLRKLGG